MRQGMQWVAGLALMAAGAGMADAATFSGLYVFGDSLVDSGNARIGSAQKGLPEQAKPADGFFAGRFSNYYNFADDIAFAITGGPATAALAGGRNFSVGGALAQYSPTETSPSFLAQLVTFQSTKQTIASDALVLVTFGGNDVRATATTGGTIDFTQAVTDLTTGLKGLYLAGARNIVVTGLPDIGQLPSAQAVAGIPNRLQELTDRSKQLNTEFDDAVTDVRRDTGANVVFFDLLDYENKLIANPTAYGLPATLNTKTPCQIPGGGVPQLANCTNSLYFDGIHPTFQIHAAIASAIETQIGIAPEPASWAMMIVGFGMVGATMRRARGLKLAA